MQYDTHLTLLVMSLELKSQVQVSLRPDIQDLVILSHIDD